MTTDDFCFYSQNRLIQTSQTGGQQYSDTYPLVFPVFCNTLERRNIYLNCIPAECFSYCPAEFRVASLILKFYLSYCHFAECCGIVHCLSVIWLLIVLEHHEEVNCDVTFLYKRMRLT
jgi:hypothetical protein